MRCSKDNFILYGVTDRKWTGKLSLLEQAEEALKNGLTCLQLREKNIDPRSFLEEAISLKKLCAAYHVPLIINDNVDIAVACNADGIHVGQDDMKAADVRKRVGENMIIGVSAHTVSEALAAQKNGGDYIGVGAVFPTSTKTNVSPMPAETLREITSAVTIPAVAIGGITKENIIHLSGTGIDGIAVVSAIFGADDIGAETSALRQLVEKYLL